MIGRIMFCPGTFMHPHVNISTSNFNTRLTAMEHVLHVLSLHSQIITQTSIKSYQNVRKWSSISQGIVASISLFKFPEKKWSTSTRCNNLCSDTVALYGNDAFIQFSKLAKGGNWHCHLQRQCTWSSMTYLMQEGYQWKEEELLFTYMSHSNIPINWL